jgi:hypothetical protein
MITIDGEQLRIWKKNSVVAYFDAHPCIRLKRIRKTRKKIAYSSETLKNFTLEYEDTTLC